MEDLPEFDAESFFGNWDETKDDSQECSSTDVDGGASGGLTASSKTNLTSDYLNQILDTAEKPNDVHDARRKGSSGGSSGGGETANLSSSSTSTNSNNFTFPMYYPANQGRNHPLAMTSMASCPPYASAEATAAALSSASSGQDVTLESAGLQRLMSQQPQQQQQQQQAPQQLALATLSNAANNNSIASNSNVNNVTASTLSYNSPYSTHLSELTANFRNNPNVSVHYGMAVNGFHPQVNAQVNPVFPLTSNGRIDGPATNQQTLGGTGGNRSSGPNNKRNQSRGGRCSNNAAAATTTTTAATAGAASTHTRNSRERNNREQVRAQKITQLIAELRENMEKDGWREEMKSKYQTLSQ